ncbi:F-box/LRR-repeat protein 2-like isoform X1 [Schistocerca nitens]|uniref:F-box/LRR-repeat protein 2-like isoform X1 n=2 Tax=Schistocerca nitens TaxID=7011 RepID=UPI0021198DB6|nr:F-box/LRR-repeat protein 2-like isoform X1 [Schistocerca nitens]
MEVVPAKMPPEVESGRCPLGINDLPDEILIIIFSHLSLTELLDVQKVCHHWKTLSRAPELWNHKEYLIGCPSVRPRDTLRGHHRARQFGATDREAIEFLPNAPDLRKVRMLQPVSPCVIRALYTSCHRLSELSLVSLQRINYPMLKNLVEKCPKINSLTIPSEVMRSEILAQAVSHLEHLRVLCLGEYDSSNETPLLLRLIADSCPQLEEVDFTFSYVNMDDLEYFLEAKNNTLKSIRIKWTMAGCVTPLLASCAGGLERLRLYKYDVHVEELEAFTALGRMENLQELKMGWIDPSPGTAALAFKDGRLRKLRALDLRCSSALDDATIIAICRGCPALRELYLWGADKLSDFAFSEIYRLQRLEILDVSCCKALGGALIPFLTGLPRLHTLIMEEMNFPKLEPGLSSIVKLSNLRRLSLQNSIVTGVPFDQFASKLVRLRNLNVKWCRRVPGGVKRLMELMPAVRIHGSFKEWDLPEDIVRLF